jgi:hypothetical protein
MVIDLFYPQRAVERFIAAANESKLGPQHVRSVLKYDSVDVEPLEFLLNHEDEWVRRCTANVVVKKGNISKVLKQALIEEEKSVLLEILRLVGKCKSGLEELVFLLESQDDAIKHSTIEMFRRAGRPDCLFSLVFSDDDDLVTRIKGYIEEHDDKA